MESRLIWLVALFSEPSNMLRRCLWNKGMIKLFPGSKMRCDESLQLDELDFLAWLVNGPGRCFQKTT